MHDHVLELSHINLHAVGVSLCLYSRQMSWVMDRSVITGVGADQSGRGGYRGGSPHHRSGLATLPSVGAIP